MTNDVSRLAAIIAAVLLALVMRRRRAGAPRQRRSTRIARGTEALSWRSSSVAVACVVGWNRRGRRRSGSKSRRCSWTNGRARAPLGAVGRRLRTTTVLGPHDAGLVLPVLVALQTLVGPRFGLPVLCGAVFGTLSVVLAWALGRRMRSAAFGLAFAALVACSPLEVTWSRLSGFVVAATTHVLLALLVGWECGRRGSVLLALVAGLVAWATVSLLRGAVRSSWYRARSSPVACGKRRPVP